MQDNVDKVSYPEETPSMGLQKTFYVLLEGLTDPSASSSELHDDVTPSRRPDADTA